MVLCLLFQQQPEVLREKLSENEKLMKEMSLTWEEKLHKTGKSDFFGAVAFKQLPSD